MSTGTGCRRVPATRRILDSRRANPAKAGTKLRAPPRVAAEKTLVYVIDGNI